MEFKRVVKFPEHLNKGAIERAVEAFVNESHTLESGAEPQGLYNQTLESMAQVLMFNQDGRQVWMADHEGEVVAYALCHVSKDVDNKLCYWITQGWVHSRVKGHKIVKVWYGVLKDEAKKLFCKHIVMPSSRNPKAYIRFLGKQVHTYVTLLKEDI